MRLSVPTRYALDTNLFIRGYRDRAGADQLKHFQAVFAPYEFLSAVVVQELRSGLSTADGAKQLIGPSSSRFNDAVVS
jgi:hypothetical protein